MSSKVEYQNDKIVCEVSKDVAKNEFLENEKLALERAMEETRKRGSENTYKNLIQAYERILLLIDKENKWKSMYSQYGLKNDETGEFEDVVSTWEQKGEDIRNHHIYKIEKEIKEETYNLYIEWTRDINKTIVYYKDCMYGIELNTYSEIRDFIIKNIIKDDNVNIYMDCFGIGLGLADSFNELGYKIQDTELINFNPKRANNILNKRVSKYTRY